MVRLTAEERATVARIRQGASRASAMVTTDIPSAYQTTCPECGGPAHATLVARWGHCMRCQQKGM